MNKQDLIDGLIFVAMGMISLVIVSAAILLV